ncbi:putative protein phosphatase 2C 65 [Bienertia sinuspersici]
MATQQGKKGINQDAMTVWEDFTGENDAFFCGVFDGHGPCGHKVARNVRDQLPTKLKVDKELSHDPSIDSYCSGTTAVTVVKQGDHLVIGNLGDSRAVMCTRGEKGQVRAVQLTVDLKPSLPREAERVKRCEGRVFALEEEPHVLRLWLPDEDSPGLAMTRAFGDFCLKDCGLISTPQVFYRKLTEQDEKRSHAAKFLATHAVRAWKSRFPSSRADDIAVVCLFFKPPPPAKSMSDISHITHDSLSHLNSSVSQHTYRSLSSDADEGFEFRDSSTSKGKFQDDSEDLDEGESLVDTTLNFPRYTNVRNRARTTSKGSDEL